MADEYIANCEGVGPDVGNPFVFLVGLEDSGELVVDEYIAYRGLDVGNSFIFVVELEDSGKLVVDEYIADCEGVRPDVGNPFMFLKVWNS